jgi:hypothetical protein
MSSVMVFTQSQVQPLGDTPYPNQMFAAKMTTPASGGPWQCDIYDGVNTSGRLVWSMQSDTAYTPDKDDFGPDGLECSTGSLYVNFTTGSGQTVFIMQK